METPSSQHLYAATVRNRLYFAQVLESLNEDQWARDSLCIGWTVRHVAAHMLQYVYVGFLRFFLVSLRYRGNTDATVDHLARRLAQIDTRLLIQNLRQHAAEHTNPPRVGPWGPFAETCIHLRDIARPLGLKADVAREDWSHLFNYLVSPDAAPALVLPERSAGLAFECTDTDDHYGNGPLIRGPAEAICMALTGRDSALADLTGPGVEVLRQRQ